jgi:hypothetical protein
MRPVYVTVVNSKESASVPVELGKVMTADTTEGIPLQSIPALPCDGVVVPFSTAYFQVGEQIVSKGVTVNECLRCKVLKRTVLNEQGYYYVQIIHDEYQQNYYLFEEDKIIFSLDDKIKE